MAHFIGVNEKTGEKSASGMASLAMKEQPKDVGCVDAGKNAEDGKDASKDAIKDERRDMGIVTKTI
jgi:hypothetical protein